MLRNIPRCAIKNVYVYINFFDQNVDCFFKVEEKSSEAVIRNMIVNPHDANINQLKKNLANKILGYLARCDFWVKFGLRFWILVGRAKFGAKSDFRV